MTYPSRLAPGQILGDRFQVTTLVGSGDLGEVYDVREVGTGYAYALKTLPPSLVGTSGIASFQQASQRLTERGHDGIVGVYAFDTEPVSRTPYIIRDLVSSPSLAQVLAAGGPLSTLAFAPILSALATVVEAIHAAGLVHGNLKPSNVFPLANAVRVTDGAHSHLRGPASPSGLWGTPGYLPFEQTGAAPDHPSSDLYVMGIVAFFALTGRLPFRAAQGAPNVAALLVELQSPLPPASHRAREIGVPLGSELDAWFSRALSVSPAARFGSAQALAESFRGAAVASTEAAFAGPETSGAYTKKGTLMLGQMPPEIAAVLAGGPGAAGERVSGGSASVVIGLAPGQGAATALVSTELATVPPGRLPAPAVMGGYVPGTSDPSLPSVGVVPLSGPPGAVASSGASAPAASTATSLPPMSGPVSAVAGVPKKRSQAAVLGAIFTGLLLLAGVAVGLFIVTRSADGDEPATPASASGSAVPSAVDSGALPGSPSAEAPPPPLGSAAPSAAPAAAPAPEDALVVLSCDPECDTVICDKKPVKDPASGVRLRPGAHTCTARKPGFVATPVTFQTVAGEDGKQTITLVKAEPPKAGGTKAPCGTFVNPCP